MDIERIVVRMTADATQYLQMFDMVEARLVAFGAFMTQELLKNSLQLAMDFERMGLAFEVMTGSAEKGRKVLTDIVDLALRTPFTTQELIKSGKQAMAFGIEDQDIIPVLERLGAVSVATGADMDRLILAFGQVRTVGRLMGQELRQFTNAGVPMLQYLARAMKVAEAEVPQLVRMGRVGFNDVAEAINLMTNEGGKFFGLLERTNLETLFGRWQNFTEGVQKTARHLGEAIIEAFDLKAVVGGWSETLNNLNFAAIKGHLETVRDLLMSVVNWVGQVVTWFGEWADANPELYTIIKTLTLAAAAVYALTTAVGILEFALGSVVLFFTPLYTVVVATVTVVWGLVTAVGALAAAFVGVVGLPVAITAGILAVVGTFLMLIGDADGLKKVLKEVAAAFGEFVGGLAGFAADVVVGGLEQIGRSLMRLYDLFGGLSNLFGEAGRGIIAAFGTGDMELGMKLFTETAKLGFKALWEWVKLEWELVWTELGITVEVGLKRAFFNAVAWLALQMDKVMRNVPGVQSKEGSILRDRQMVNEMLDVERATRMAAAAQTARDRIDDLTRSLNDSAEAAGIRQMAHDAQFNSAVGREAADFHKQFVMVIGRAWGAAADSPEAEAARRLVTAPINALMAAAGGAAVGTQAEFERLALAAFDAGAKLNEAFEQFERGAISRQQFDAAKVAAAQARTAFQSLQESLTGAAAQARRAANDIGKVFETSAATRAYMLDLSKEFDRGTTSLEKFTRGMRHLEEAVAGPFQTLNRRDAAVAALGGAAIFGNRQLDPIMGVGDQKETFGLFKEYQNLRRAVGSSSERRPPAALEGSREAAEILGRASTAQLTVEQQIHADLLTANEIHRQQRDYMAQVANEIRRRRNAGELMPVPVPLNMPE